MPLGREKPLVAFQIGNPLARQTAGVQVNLDSELDMPNLGAFIDLLQPSLAALDRLVSVSFGNSFDADDIVPEAVYKEFLHFDDSRFGLRSVKMLTLADTARQRSNSRAAVKSRYHRPLHRLSGMIGPSAAPVEIDQAFPKDERVPRGIRRPLEVGPVGGIA